MAGAETLKVRIDTDGGPISVVQLSDYLIYLRAAYVHVLRDPKVLGLGPIEYLQPNEVIEYAERFIATGPTSPIPAAYLQEVGHAKLEPWQELQVIDLSRSNPIELVLQGLGAALVVAVIFSGGKISITGIIKAELPPLGKGIEALLKAFGRSQPPRPRVQRKKDPSE